MQTKYSKTKWSLIALALATCWAWASTATAKKEPPSIAELCMQNFETGMKLGWAASGKGATPEDVLFLIECRRRNDHAAFDAWFRNRDAK